ncbi:MAG: iron-containing alcohol dehydrogenase [Polyangiaceae bacterium]
MLSDKVFELMPGVRAHFGCGSLEKLPRLVRATERERVFIITDAGVETSGIPGRVQSALAAEGLLVEVLPGVRSNPRVEQVEALSARVRTATHPVLVAVGGGSSMDSAKAVALLSVNGGSLSDFPPGCRPAHAGHPVVCVPTTAGTGSETNMFAAIIDPRSRRKMVVGHPSVLPEAVILDPELTLGVPADVSAHTGMDALAHAIEAFTSNRHNPLSDALALRALAALVTFLPSAVENGSDLEARAQMLLAAHLAGLAFASSGLGLCHALAHPLSGRLDVSHGQALATLLPHVMRFNFGVCEARYAQLSIALGVRAPGVSDAENAHRSISAVERLSQSIGTQRSATELGVERKHLPELVEDAMADLVLSGTPRFPEPGDVLALYEAAL